MKELFAAPAELDEAPPVLLAYQAKWVGSEAKVRICEKSRRTGLSWAEASDAVTTAAATKAAGGMDALYIGFNLEMAREFIDYCGVWARHLGAFAATAEAFDYKDVLDNDTRDIKAFRVTFASGYEIIALSSRPRSLRGRQGLVIVDEAAFHDDLKGLLKAAMALLIWGGRVAIISTHDGDDNYFNELINECRSGRLNYEVHRITFDEALEQDLYKRICYVQGRVWSPEAEAAWAAEVRGFYGDGASEELDVIPSKGSGVYMPRALVEQCMSDELKVVRLICRADFAQQPEERRRAEIADWLDEHVAPLLAQLDPALASFFGEDFARSANLTVVAIGQRLKNMGLNVPIVLELQNTPFAQQEQILHFVIDRLPRFSAGKMDGRGNGQALAEATVDRYGVSRIEAVMATGAWYLEHMPRMKARFEDVTIAIPRSSDLLEDMRQVKLIAGIPQIPAGKTEKDSGGAARHGDFAIACCMLVAAEREDVIPMDGFQSAGRPRQSAEAFAETAGSLNDFGGAGRLDFGGF